jgi:hypothetical protein
MRFGLGVALTAPLPPIAVEEDGLVTEDDELLLAENGDTLDG